MERRHGPAGPRSVASRRKMRVTPVSPNASMLARISARASASLSTNRQKAAPREMASSPSAPVPAKRSMTRAPVKREILDAVGQDIEQALAHAVRRRARPRARAGDGAPAQGAGDDPHARRRAALGVARLARARSSSTGSLRLSSAASRGAQLIGEHMPLYRLGFAGLQVEKLERPVGDADQAVHVDAEVGEDAPHLAVLALAQGHGDPGVGALHAVEAGLDRPVAHAFDSMPSFSLSRSACATRPWARTR